MIKRIKNRTEMKLNLILDALVDKHVITKKEKDNLKDKVKPDKPDKNTNKK